MLEVFEDRASGAKADRAGLMAVLSYARHGGAGFAPGLPQPLTAEQAGSLRQPITLCGFAGLRVTLGGCFAECDALPLAAGANRWIG